VRLPQRHKAFLERYGGGMFNVIDIFAADELVAVNDAEFPDRDLIAVAPVGTGDHWGFPVHHGHCHDEVWLHHDDGVREPHRRRLPHLRRRTRPAAAVT
jgi:hypothetical protein